MCVELNKQESRQHRIGEKQKISEANVGPTQTHNSESISQSQRDTLMTSKTQHVDCAFKKKLNKKVIKHA